jgi:hypothetical protein
MVANDLGIDLTRRGGRDPRQSRRRLAPPPAGEER